METAELLETIARGEDSPHQFKADVTNAASLGAEMVALANGGGGQIFIGVADDGTLQPHTAPGVKRLNELIANAATNCVRPPINPVTENVPVPGGVVIVVAVPEGLSKPYMDNTGAIWVKSGSDKRRVTSREEMQRIFQAAQLIHGDEVPVAGSSIADIDLTYLATFFKARLGRVLENLETSLPQILTNMRLLSGDRLTVAGALLFAKEPEFLLPIFHIKAVSYPGNDIHTTTYLENRDVLGRIETQFADSLAFVLRHLRWEQNGQGINSLGILEIPRVVFEELIVNALIHRDYFVSAPIRIFIFSNRIEIISPGHLPNNLAVDNVRSGMSNIRNIVLASFATRILPYSGLGTGILRALKEYPAIEFDDDRERNQFRVIVRRRTSHPV